MADPGGDDAAVGPRGDVDIRPLASEDDRRGFSSSVASLAAYLRNHAGQDSRRGLAVVYVLTDPTRIGRIRGYFSLSNCSVELAGLPVEVAGGLGRYSHVPALLIGRLAVAQTEQGAGVGRRLLGDALARIRVLSEQAGCAIVVVDAIDEGAARFYGRAGFVGLEPTPDEPTWPRRMVLPLSWIERLERR